MLTFFKELLTFTDEKKNKLVRGNYYCYIPLVKEGDDVSTTFYNPHEMRL